MSEGLPKGVWMFASSCASNPGMEYNPLALNEVIAYQFNNQKGKPPIQRFMFEVVNTLTTGNQIMPSGTLPLGNKEPMVAVNTVVTKPKELESIVIRPGRSPTVYHSSARAP